MTIAALVAAGAAVAKMAAKAPQLMAWARRMRVGGGGRAAAGEGAGAASEAAAPVKKSAPEPPPKATPKTEPLVEKPPTAKRLPLEGVTAAEMDLAAAPTSPYEAVAASQMAAREKVAVRFYQQYGGLPADEAAAQASAIEVTKPVKIGPPPPCPSPQAQWQVPGGRQGQYYADQGTSPSTLGIHDQGATMGPEGWGSGPTEPKVATMYEVPPDAPYLESTSAPVEDTWSIPGESHPTDGGATQRYIPKKSSTVTQF